MKTLQEAICKPVKGYEGLYEVSSQGVIYSLNYAGKRGKRKALKPQKMKNGGYLAVTLSKDGKNKTCKIHRLVAEHFIPNPKSLPQVNHKLGDKSKNSVTDLEWSTNADNTKHAYAHGLMKPRRGAANSMARKVLQVSLSGEVVREWPSVKDAVDKYNHSLKNVLTGTQKTAGGYKWRYA